MSNITREIVWQTALEQSARDCCCTVDDLLRCTNTVVVSKPLSGAKRYYTEPHFCQLISYGYGTVAVADPRIKDFIADYLDSQSEPFRCFDTPNINRLYKKMEEYGKTICFMAQFFLPDPNWQGRTVDRLEMKVLHGEEIARLYSDDRFHMALSYTVTGDRKDVVAVAGYIDGKLAGVAGASDDCETMWQVGIDVLPEFRRRGIASALTDRVTKEVLKMGRVPFYCTAWSNIASKRNAYSSGYKDAWVEITVNDISFTEQ